MSTEVTEATEELGIDELRSRLALARSVLGHAPAYRAIRKALRALEGATLEELAADQEVTADAPDGWDAGYTTAVQRHGSAA